MRDSYGLNFMISVIKEASVEPYRQQQLLPLPTLDQSQSIPVLCCTLLTAFVAPVQHNAGPKRN
jgi:hypothetical protein